MILTVVPWLLEVWVCVLGPQPREGESTDRSAAGLQVESF